MSDLTKDALEWIAERLGYTKVETIDGVPCLFGPSGMVHRLRPVAAPVLRLSTIPGLENWLLRPEIKARWADLAVHCAPGSLRVLDLSATDLLADANEGVAPPHQALVPTLAHVVRKAPTWPASPMPLERALRLAPQVFYRGQELERFCRICGNVTKISQMSNEDSGLGQTLTVRQSSAVAESKPTPVFNLIERARWPELWDQGSGEPAAPWLMRLEQHETAGILVSLEPLHVASDIAADLAQWLRNYLTAREIGVQVLA